MSTAKRPRGGKKAATTDDTHEVIIRGLTDEDMAAIERASERRRATLQAAGMGGTYVSRNATLLSLLRAAITREESDAVKGAS